MVNSGPTAIKNNNVHTTNISSMSLVFEHSANLSLLFNQFNNFTPEKKKRA